MRVPDEQEAHQWSWDAWNNTEIILDMNDFEAAEMHVMDDGQKFDGGKTNSFIEGHDYGFGKGKGTAKNGR